MEDGRVGTRGNAPEKSDELGSLRKNGNVGEVNGSRDGGGGLLLLGAVVGAHALGGRDLGAGRHVDLGWTRSSYKRMDLKCQSRDIEYPANWFV